MRFFVLVFVAFPSDCLEYYGPHNEPCLKNALKSVGCVEDGEALRTPMTAVHIAMQARKNLR